MFRTIIRPRYIWKPAPQFSGARSHSTSRGAFDNQTLEITGDIHNFTRGRFVANEKFELAQRHVKYDVHQLARIAAEAVDAQRCVRVEKFPDGLYNKALLLTMDDGREVVAKVPNSNAGRPHFTTASEVATMKFVRRKLKTPLPKVYTWCSRLEDNPVGAEYIIMEKASGVQLESTWPKLGVKDRFAVVKTLGNYQKAWASIRFHGSGSIYFTDDIPSDMASALAYTDSSGLERTDPEFSLGPTTGREWFDNGRAELEFDRGPYVRKTLLDYHAAIGKREQICIRGLKTLPTSTTSIRGPGLYDISRQRKLLAVDVYNRLSKHLIPRDPAISMACLWHGDLHEGNIFVDPSDPGSITGLIDWQATTVSPIYFHARQPFLIDYNGPEIHGLKRPELPADYEQLDSASKRSADILFLKQSLCVLYRTLMHQICPDIYRSMEFQQTDQFSLLLLARNLLIDGEAAYLAQAIEIERSWSEIASGSPFSLSFSEAEKDQVNRDLEASRHSMDVMNEIRNVLGTLFPAKGLVRHDQYDEATDALRQVRDQVIDEFAKTEEDRKVWLEQWPFDS